MDIYKEGIEQNPIYRNEISARISIQNMMRYVTYNDKIRETLNVDKLTTDIEKNRLKWFGHLKRMEKGRLHKEC